MVKGGYRPIHLKDKRPLYKGWPEIVATDELVRSWETEYPGDRNTGALTREMPTIDIDILDPKGVEIIESLVRRRFKGKGKLLKRVGMAPKCAFPFRSEAPFEKLLVPLWAPAEPEPKELKDCKHRIEILGDGQQVVVHGIHPDTKRLYEWTGGEPWTVERAELPLLTVEEAKAFLAEAYDLLVKAGWGVFETKDKEREKKITEGEYPQIVELGIKAFGEISYHSDDEYRFGSHGSKSVDLRTKTWFDFEANTGGGVRDLMKLVSGAALRTGSEDTVQKLLLSSKEFVEGFVPPDYLVDGLLQRKYVYSLTGPTGSGKTAVALRIAAHVALGLSLGGLAVEKGRVLYFAGENPDDVRTRWIKLFEEMEVDPADMDVFFMSGVQPIATGQVRTAIEEEVKAFGAPLSLLIVDTSAAYYTGDDENDNKQLGDHARMLRSFENLWGGPTILVTCHPTKNPDMSNLLPRGGGAFLAEVDGNLVCLHERGSGLVEIDTHGKFRGPEFVPFSFKLIPGTSDNLKDSKGRLIWTVFAEPVTAEERTAIENASDRKGHDLLRAMKDRPASSISELADVVGWSYKNGDPNKSLVQRLLGQLKREKLVEMRGKRYVLSRRGIEVADEPRPAEPM
jgi:hypothetical protein